MASDKFMREDYKVRFAREWYENIYALDLRCSNCAASRQVLIRKGVLKETVAPMECPLCGCKTLVLV